MFGQAFFTGRQWRGRPYLISPFCDLMMAGGLALLVFFALFIFFPPHHPALDQQTLAVAAVMVWLAFGVNDPHFIVSYQLLYKNYPAKLRRFRGTHPELWLRYIVAGIAVPVFMAAYFIYAITTRRAELFEYAIFAMLLTVGWHYTKQAYGVFIMLSAMKKVYYSRWQRRVLLINSYVTWLFYAVGIASEPQIYNAAAHVFWGIDYHPHQYFDLTITPLLGQVVGGLFDFFTLAALLVIVWDKRRPAYSKTGLVAYFSMVYFLLFVAFHPMWILLYPFFHSLQYLLFVYAYKRGETKIRLSKAENSKQRKAVYMSALRFAAVAILIGILCFAIVPDMLEAWLNPTKTLFLPLVASAIVFINIHHYFIDNVIWRKEHAEIAEYMFYS